MNTMLQTIKTYLESNDLNFHLDEGKELIHLEFDDISLHIISSEECLTYIFANDSLNKLTEYSAIERLVALEWLMNQNYALKIGNFEYDTEDHDCRFKIIHRSVDEQIALNECEYLLKLGLSTMQKTDVLNKYVTEHSQQYEQELLSVADSSPTEFLKTKKEMTESSEMAPLSAEEKMAVIKKGFEKLDWDYKYSLDERDGEHILKTGFGTKKYKDNNGDDGVVIVIRLSSDGEDLRIESRNTWAAFKYIEGNSQESLDLIAKNLGLYALNHVFQKKYGKVWLDPKDGELNIRIDLLLGTQLEFHQVRMCLGMLQGIIDESHEFITKLIKDDNGQTLALEKFWEYRTKAHRLDLDNSIEKLITYADIKEQDEQTLKQQIEVLISRFTQNEQSEEAEG